MALWKAGEEVQIKSQILIHGIVEGRESWNLDHCGRQTGGC